MSPIPPRTKALAEVTQSIMSTVDLSHLFARHVADARYDTIPPDAIEGAKKSLLDTLGVMLAGSGMEPAVKGVTDIIFENGGRADCDVFGFRRKVPAPMAAFANGVLAHCLDYDDQTPWGAHPDSSVIPAVLAAAQYKGGISGKELLTAIAVGQDLFVRLRCNVRWRQDWNLSSVVGVYSATAAAAYVLGLAAPQIAHAFGIASMQSAGTMEVIFGIGSDLRGMYAGFTAQGALQAVLMARNGITGVEHLFEGPSGVFKVYFDGEYDRNKMLAGLGQTYLGGSTLYKAWPAVGNVHTYIHAAIELMREHRVTAQDIEQIRAYVGDFHMRMCTPLDVRRAPRTLVDAKFSLPFCVALALHHGGIRIKDFSAVSLTDPSVLSLAEKVVPVEDSAYDWTSRIPDGCLELVMRDGRVLKKVGSNVPGSLEAPLNWQVLGEKFNECAAVAATTITPATAQGAAQLVQSLETVERVQDLFDMLIR